MATALEYDAVAVCVHTSAPVALLNAYRIEFPDPMYTSPFEPMDGEASTAEPVLNDQATAPVEPASAYTYLSSLPKYTYPVAPL